MMDRSNETEIVPLFEEVETQTTLLAQRVAAADKADISVLRALVREAKKLDGQLHASLRPMSIEHVNARYPNRVEVFHSLTTSLIAAAEVIPFGQLTSEDWKYYVEALADNAGERFGEATGGYYHFGWPIPYFERPEGSTLLEEVATNPKSELTAVQEEKVYRFEEGTFKVHLNIPSPEDRFAAMKKFLGVLQGDNDIVGEIFKEKKQRGEQQMASVKEIKTRGGRLAKVNQWKIKEFIFPSQGDRPDIVFYIGTSAHQTPVEALEMTVREIAAVMESERIETDDRLPRFSSPVTIAGQAVHGLSVVQGNGDFKEYLLRSGGEEKLARFYGPATNFAFRPGQTVSF